MFKDVISRGWWRVHIVMFSIFSLVGFVTAVTSGFHYYKERWTGDNALVAFVVFEYFYLIIFLTIVWVKRGFKKS